MKTLADLKRDLVIGSSITLVEAPDMPDHKFLNIKRYVVKKQGNGVYLNADKNAVSGSFLEFKNAKLTEYDGNTIKIFLPGSRPMTEQEKVVFDNKPSRRPENAKRAEQEMLSDGNGLFWLDRAYLKENGMEYLISGAGLTKHFHYNDQTITDEQLKGKLELSYIIE
jgi:hypothetical protein